MARRDYTRRDFLKTASAATLSAMAAGYPMAAMAQKDTPAIAPTADTVIILWMGGGMAHTETFDPKKFTPFQAGLESNAVLSTFPSIDTNVDGVKFSEGLERLAQIMDRGTLIRTYKAADLGFILHSRHQFHWHTGYEPPQSVAVPHIGSVISRALGPVNPDVPAFIDIGQRYDNGEGEELKAFHTAGFLGTEYGPFLVPGPEDSQSSVQPPAGMTAERFVNRDKQFRSLVEKSPVGEFGSSFQKESMMRSLDNAYRLLNSPASKAFDLSLEPKESYDIYNTGRFGLGCLLARRLCEVGARFIEVTTEYIPFKHWDTHENGHTRLAELKPMIDRPIAQLVLDLEKRGLLDRTLIVLASEFSRDMMTEGKPDNAVINQVEVPNVMTEMKHYGMHRHFTDAGCVMLYGGGMKAGHVHGKTADERPCKTLEKPVYLTDLHSTIYRAVGIPPTHSYINEQRPVFVTKDGKGQPVMELFA